MRLPGAARLILFIDVAEIAPVATAFCIRRDTTAVLSRSDVSQFEHMPS